MKRYLFVVLSLLAACEPDLPADEPSGITGACGARSAPRSRLGVAQPRARGVRVPGRTDPMQLADKDMPCDEPVGVNQTR
jgi:hypothetical protein